ncbi:MAG: response regulator [Thaumarchaeota archaeon]|nr:response regulator [Nitrososphaerota archaeon]
MARVMIVENPEKPLWLAKKLLFALNHEIVFETGNGYEAIEKYNIIKPDLLILDLILSKNDGLCVLKEIKKSHPESRIIIVTLLADPKLLEDCIKFGAHTCVTIPFKMKDFVTLVTDVCNSPYEKLKAAPVIID